MNFHGTKGLHTKRLILRKISVDDYKSAYINYCSRANVCRLLTWYPHDSEKDTKEYYESEIKKYNEPNYYAWVITFKDQPHDVIGCISSVKLNIENKEIEIGYVLSDDYWHQGIMSEAFAEVIKYLFLSEDFENIIACYLEENPHSGDVMHKCGLKYDYTKNVFYTKLNKNVQMIYMKLNKSDYLIKE